MLWPTANFEKIVWMNKLLIEKLIAKTNNRITDCETGKIESNSTFESNQLLFPKILSGDFFWWWL